MDKRELVNIMQKIEQNKAVAKMGYWKTVGEALLESDGLSEKWDYFVESQVKDPFARGDLIDETLQIMSMIKGNLPVSTIAQTIERIPGGQTILDSYLCAFIHPDILDEIQSQISTKTR